MKPGDTVVCVKSASPGYKVGSHYTVYLNKDGKSCLQGDDGFEDLTERLVSQFSVVNETV